MTEEKLQELLFDYLVDNFPSELDRLSTHTRIEDVSDLTIKTTKTNGSVTEITGEASVDVEIAYESDRDRARDNDDNGEYDDSFRFTFNVSIEDGQIKGQPELVFDTDHFYN